MLIVFSTTLFITSVLLSLTYSKQYTLIIMGTLTLMMFHQDLILNIPLLPDPGPFQIVLIGVALTSSFHILAKWRFSFTDILIFSLSVLIIYSQYHSAYSILTKTSIATTFLSILLPYTLFKTFLGKGKYDIIFLKMMIYCSIVIILTGVWEMRMTHNIFKEIAATLNNEFQSHRLAMRWGLVRINGPFGGHIIAGLMLGLVFLMNLILTKSKLWNKKFQLFPIPINKPFLFSLILGVGVLMPISRITLFSVILSIIAYTLISRRLTNPISLIYIGVFCLISFSGYTYYQSTISGSLTIAESETSMSSRARDRKMDELIPIIKANPYFGVGNKGNLVEEKENPTDNHFLHLAHLRGIPAMGIFLLIGVYQFFSLIRRGKRVQKEYPIDAIFAYGYASIILFLHISLTQVVLFRSLGIIFYGLIGLFEAHIIAEVGYLDRSSYVRKFTNKKKKKHFSPQTSPS